MRDKERAYFVEEIEFLRQGFRTVVDFMAKDDIERMSMEAYHKNADRLIVELGGESVRTDNNSILPKFSDGDMGTDWPVPIPPDKPRWDEAPVWAGSLGTCIMPDEFGQWRWCGGCRPIYFVHQEQHPCSCGQRITWDCLETATDGGIKSFTTVCPECGDSGPNAKDGVEAMYKWNDLMRQNRKDTSMSDQLPYSVIGDKAQPDGSYVYAQFEAEDKAKDSLGDFAGRFPGVNFSVCNDRHWLNR